MFNTLPISAVVPTRNRSTTFAKTLSSLAQQSLQPVEMIVIDASTDDQTHLLCQSEIANLKTQLRCYKATEVGAAKQRNQAMVYVSHAVIWFMDDDILLEPECLSRLWSALQSDPLIGGVNAMITNQRYMPPSKISRTLFQFLNGRAEASYAGKCIGPALNLLPEDDPHLPEIVQVEWLNTTCTLYRHAALPQPLFSEHFTGYSLMEDVTLSLIVGRDWQLVNARTARIYHDSQPGDHKSDTVALAKMGLVNRHFVMTQILGKGNFSDYIKLAVLQIFEVISFLKSWRGFLSLPLILWGKLKAILELIFSKSSANKKS